MSKIKINNDFFMKNTIENGLQTEYINGPGLTQDNLGFKIQGPINLAILEGKKNNIFKRVYIFMDYHYEIDKQTKCESFDSEDISNFLYKKIKNATKETDFFMEIRKEQIGKPRYKKKDIYKRDSRFI